MNFYKFCTILESSEHRGYDSWKLAAPPGWDSPDWSPESLEWTPWEERSESVWLVNGEFLDRNRKPMPWLASWAEEASNWGVGGHREMPWIKDNPDLFKKSFWPKEGMPDHSKALDLSFQERFGEIPATENPHTGEGHDNMPVAVEIKGPVLSHGGKRADLSGSEGKIAGHFYPKLETP